MIHPSKRLVYYTVLLVDALFNNNHFIVIPVIK